MNENSRLRGEMEKLELDLQTRLHAHKQQLEGAESSLNTLLQRQSTDEAAIAGLVATVQELRGEKVQSAARVTALQRDLEESGRELTAAVTKWEELVRAGQKPVVDIVLLLLLLLFTVVVYL